MISWESSSFKMVVVLLSLQVSRVVADMIVNDAVTAAGPIATVAGFVDARQAQCIDMVKVSTDLVYEQRDATRALCGIYFIAEPNELVAIQLHGVDIHCEQGEFVEIFDGWMARDRILPSEQDHPTPTSSRLHDYCRYRKSSNAESLEFLSSQNFALVQFRLKPGSRLSIAYRRVTGATHEKCNVIIPEEEGEYTMRSFVDRNCTFSIVQSSVVVIKEIKLSSAKDSVVEILKGDSLDPTEMTLVKSFKGPIHFTKDQRLILDKDHAAVRMTSSRRHTDDFVRFTFAKLDSEEALKAEICT